VKWQFSFVAIACPTLLACATTDIEQEIPERGVTPGYMCKTNGLEAMVGSQANGEVGADALKKSGAKRLRWIAPNTAVTMDFRQDRLNISYDYKMVITRVNCG